ncbi:hypothetical protein AJ80_04584 [Polytolypa hystricis UAMH7299]|uniref:Uncharacterized protein n=1 Tax=Polytolypa hystricis (strain UAMH7299) TaxID=1447883 RepID=A0A2B7YC80_POLH7|nr:hypothetical protein AJ80_04584 [Polytolypa hystricis UAMH7299]
MTDRPDRPDRAPVWVRGGPPYYYQPVRADTMNPGETLRRASTTSSISSEPGEFRERASFLSSSPNISPSRIPNSPLEQLPPPQGVSPQTRSTPQSPLPSPASSSSTSAPKPPEEPQHFFKSGLHRSITERTGSRRFSNLSNQKRDSQGDHVRRTSWQDQVVGSNPERNRYIASWWDSFTKGYPRSQNK